MPVPILLESMLAVIIVVALPALLVYWISRSFLLIHGSKEAIDEALDCDLWWGRRLLHCVRSLFELPIEFIG
jgi:hypothetical protein